ncbi:MAG TPA: DsbA family protein [Azospirillaceae bacterium]|nr:DsbA family protein [Azospirillaceae bacterium]
MLRLPLLPALALTAALTATPASAAEPALDRAAVEKIVREYILANPEIITEAVTILQRREEEAEAKAQAETLAKSRDALFASKTTPVGGNPKGDVTIVEFFDYNCGYCKRSQPELEAALESDGKVKVVYKELPILGPSSTVASKVALAAAKQGKYEPVHTALMNHKGKLDDSTIFELAEDAGADMKRLRKDMEDASVQAEIDANLKLAQDLGIRGTPAFIIHDTMIPGAIDKDAFLASFKAAREAKRS